MRISIVIPLFNKGKLIKRALESIANQKGVLNDGESSVEVIVVDDGSSDDSVEYVRAFTEVYNHLPVRIVNQKNSGVGAARNRGINDASGEYVAFLDADDEWTPEHLADLRNMAREFPSCAILATNYENKLPNGTTIQNRLSNLPFNGRNGIIDNYFVMAAASNPPLWTSAVMVRRDALLTVGGFPEGIKSGEDLLTWARLAIDNEIAFDSNPSAIYYRGNSNPRPPEATDEVGRQLEMLYKTNTNKPGLRQYLALWFNMRMSRCLAHRMYGKAFKALCKSFRYRPTIRIAKPLIKYTLLGLQPHNDKHNIQHNNEHDNQRNNRHS